MIRYLSRHSFGINELFHERGKGDDLDSLLLDLGNRFSEGFDGCGVRVTDADGFSCRKGVLDQFIDLLLDTVFIKGIIKKNAPLRRPQPQNLCRLKTEGLRGGPAVQEEEISPL